MAPCDCPCVRCTLTVCFSHISRMLLRDDVDPRTDRPRPFSYQNSMPFWAVAPTGDEVM